MTPDPLSAFIEARLAERAATAWLVHDVSKCDALLYEEDMAGAAARDPDCDCGMPAATLRDVAAKRAILARHAPVEAPGRGVRCSWCSDEFDHPWPCEDVRDLAAIDAGHPDYDPSWAPGES